MAEITPARVSDEELARQMREARARGLTRRATEPFALRAAYDAERHRVEAELSNGFCFSFPPTLFPELARGTSEQLADLHVDPSGYVLHWARLDADYDIAGLVQVALGARKWMSVAELGRLGGSSTSEAKKAAAAANGRKGGRPRGKKKAAKQASKAR
jgi:hypothetical protein